MNDHAGRLTRSPRLVVRRKSFELRILSNRGNTVGVMSGRQAGAALRRRAEMMARPARVRIRKRKPWACDADCSAGMCACSRENSHIFGVLDNQGTALRGTHRSLSGQLAAVA